VREARRREPVSAERYCMKLKCVRKRLILKEILVEATGVELITMLTARKLLIPGNATRAKKALMLKHYSPAHTDSDISVYFSEADILHTGDTFWNRDYPFIDYGTGGSIDGHIRAAEANIAKVTGKTIVIAGHGSVGGKADLILFRDVLVEIRDKVAALKKQGKSLPDVVAAKPGARYDAVWGNLFQNPSDFVALVYQGV
jgi:hypothetical protein